MSQMMQQAFDELSRGRPIVFVTIARTRGSAPREVGAKLLVTDHGILGSIGGGRLEHHGIDIAKSLRERAAGNSTRLHTFTLGADCGQCCGGVVDVIFERYEDVPEWLRMVCAGGKQATNTALKLRDGNADRRVVPGDAPWQAESKSILFERFGGPIERVAVFGAGHVGRAVVELLSTLELEITWIDARPHEFPEHIPDNVVPMCRQNPAALAAELADATSCLVMTHSHALDFDICARLLPRQDIPFCGLIGSTSKRRRFERLLKQAGLAAYGDKLTCPIGIEGIGGKTPAEIAVSVAAQLLQRRDAQQARATKEAAIASLHR